MLIISFLLGSVILLIAIGILAITAYWAMVFSAYLIATLLTFAVISKLLGDGNVIAAFVASVPIAMLATYGAFKIFERHEGGVET